MDLKNTIIKQNFVCVTRRKTMGNKGEAKIFTVYKKKNQMKRNSFIIRKQRLISQQQTLNVAYIQLCPIQEFVRKYENNNI
jgi:hypothetical protein